MADAKSTIGIIVQVETLLWKEASFRELNRAKRPHHVRPSAWVPQRWVRGVFRQWGVEVSDEYYYAIENTTAALYYMGEARAFKGKNPPPNSAKYRRMVKRVLDALNVVQYAHLLAVIIQCQPRNAAEATLFILDYLGEYLKRKPSLVKRAGVSLRRYEEMMQS